MATLIIINIWPLLIGIDPHFPPIFRHSGAQFNFCSPELASHSAQVPSNGTKLKSLFPPPPPPSVALEKSSRCSELLLGFARRRERASFKYRLCKIDEKRPSESMARGEGDGARAFEWNICCRCHSPSLDAISPIQVQYLLFKFHLIIRSRVNCKRLEINRA